MVCHFHADEWSPGSRQSDGSYAHVCERSTGHPDAGPWRWLVVPPAPGAPALGGLAEELSLDSELPEAILALGEGWWEYGLVERSYATRRPQDWARMVDQWSHTAIAPRQYTASSYLAGTLGRLSRAGAVAFHPGVGTGRWSYNTDISWWATLPPPDWRLRTSWVDEVGDRDPEAQSADETCRSYVPGA